MTLYLKLVFWLSAEESVSNRTNPVLARYHNRGFAGERFFAEGDWLENRFKISTDVLKVSGTSLFHLDLDSTVLRIHIIEDLFSGFPRVGLYFIIEVFVDVYEAPRWETLSRRSYNPAKS